MTEQEYQFDSEDKNKKSGLGNFIWNSQTKEFLGRSGASWAKVSFFYSVFYACLGGFFIGMLAVFMQIMPVDKPTYYAEDSTMAQKGLNPGMGFRPQVDVEDNLIAFNNNEYENEKGFKKLTDNLKIFLEAKYPEQNQDEIIDCVDGQDYSEELKAGKSCSFDYKKVFEGTNCTEEHKFGYNTNKVCVLVKLNKIVGWSPKSDDHRVEIKCEGSTSVDVDNLKKITYHSENNLNGEAGYISTKYFPYYSQKSYRAPFVFVQFDLETNVLVNVRCRAYANNIDNEDNTNMRGQTKFSLYLNSL